MRALCHDGVYYEGDSTCRVSKGCCLIFSCFSLPGRVVQILSRCNRERGSHGTTTEIHRGTGLLYRTSTITIVKGFLIWVRGKGLFYLVGGRPFKGAPGKYWSVHVFGLFLLRFHHILLREAWPFTLCATRFRSLQGSLRDQRRV